METGSELDKERLYRIGEVSDLTGVKPHVLRYWESEFPTLAPTKSDTNQRLYRPEDIEMVLKVKSLLYEEGYTIAGARSKLAGIDVPAAVQSEATANPSSLDDLGSGLNEMRFLLKTAVRELKVIRDVAESALASGPRSVRSGQA